MEHLLEIRGLSKRYDGFALENVDLTVPAGSIAGLVGENGAGKTTTIKAALDLVHPDAGEISLFGEPAISPVAMQRTGVVLDACMLPEYSTVRAAEFDLVVESGFFAPARCASRAGRTAPRCSRPIASPSRSASPTSPSTVRASIRIWDLS